jgi:hypothetical protein
MKLIQEILLGSSSIRFFDTNVVRVEVFGSVTIGYNEALEINEAIGTLSHGRQCLVLMLADEISSVNKEAMIFSASEEGLRYTIADALVVKSIRQRIMANVYLKFFKPKKPTRIFTSESEAVKWLRSQQNVFVPA